MCEEDLSACKTVNQLVRYVTGFPSCTTEHGHNVEIASLANAVSNKVDSYSNSAGLQFVIFVIQYSRLSSTIFVCKSWLTKLNQIHNY